MAKKSAARADRAAAHKKLSGEGLAGIWQPDELPFIEAILADRWNDAPRLIFADWLEERGDPRGEFIRVQCQLARLRLTDPARDLLEARSEQLTAKYGRAWMKPYPKLPATTWGVQHGFRFEHFRRGLPAAVTCKSVPGFVNRAPLLIESLGMSALKLYVSNPEEAERAARVPQLAQIDELAIRVETGWTDVGPLWRAPLGPVRRLVVGSSHELQAGLAQFLAREDSQALRELVLPCSVADLETLLEWKHLDKLDRLSPCDGAEFFDLFEHSALRVADYTFDTDRPAGVRCFSRLAQAPLLSLARSLHINTHNAMPELWSRLQLPPRVRELSIGGAHRQVDLDANVLALLESPAVERLETLRLYSGYFRSFGTMTESTAVALVRSERLQHLRKLQLPASVRYDVAQQVVATPCEIPTITLKGAWFDKEQRAELRKKFPGTLELDD